MIFKVKINQKDNYISLFKEISNNYEFCYSDGIFFIYSKNNDVEKKFKNYSCSISELKENENISNLSPLVKEWCYDIFFKETIFNLENTKEGQNRLKYVYEALEEIERKRGENTSDGKSGNIQTKKARKKSTTKSDISAG